MFVPFRRKSCCLLILALLGAWSYEARAQQVAFRTVEETQQQRVVEVSVSWPLTLSASVDSARVDRLSAAALAKLSGGLLSASEAIPLQALVSPSVRILSAEFDEVALPLGTSDASLRAYLSGPPASAEGTGLSRKQPVTSLEVRFFGYDEETGRLRRYRRLLMVLDLTSAAARGGALLADNPHLAVTESVLAGGTVYKIPVTTEGLYKIDRQALTEMGLTPGSIDPDNVKIYGNGGAPVPAFNGAPRLADLEENPVFVRGGGDGSFGDNDVVLFHARVPSGWRFNPERSAWEHYVHPFSNENYYFLKIDNAAGRRVGLQPFPNFADAQVVQQATGRFFLDIDENVWSKEHGSGYTWVSNQIRSGGTRTLLANQALPGLMAGTVRYEARVAIASNPLATVVFESGTQRLGEIIAPGQITRGAEFPTARAATLSFNQTVGAGATLNLRMRLLEQINEPEAALDWLRVFYDKALQAENGVLRFATPGGTAGRFEFTLSGFSAAPQVWDVTEPGAVQRLEPRVAGNGYRIQVEVADPAQPRELVAFLESAATRVAGETATRAEAQNLHGLQGYPDLAIITPTDFLESANILAEHRRQDGLEVVVVETGKLFNEFSGGLPDMRAVRDYFKYLYDRAPDEARRLRYGLLLGDGHYDFRNIKAAEGTLQNWIFPFETEESFITDATFTSDDYFGLLDDNEGLWTYTNFRAVSNERMDIGVGRLPVQTVEEARMVVNKILSYENPATYGAWRSTYTFAADDGPTGLSGTQNDYDLHVQNVDQVAELIRGTLYPEINVRKIYAESFPRVFLNGFRIPEAKREINAALNEGTLVFNYSGHGGPDGLAQEELFTKEDAIALTNKDKLAIFVTATCSFGWWDIDNAQSGAETLLLNPNGGAVALMTTVRLVYTSADTTSLNAGLNRALNQALFRRDEDGLPRRLGDAMLETKNTTVGLQGNSRKFNLLGDPSMRIGVPDKQVAIETVNGVPLAEQTAQMRALDRVNVTGAIRHADGTLDSAFNGRVEVTVFDASRNISLLQQWRMPTPYYIVREDLIWRGEVNALNGAFSATFVVPKDISYSNQPGRIAAYAASTDAQALGYTERFVVGGTSDTPPNDALGPEIRLFLNDTTFVAGGLTSAEPELIVKLFDQSGINTVGAGVGHEMLLVINDDEGRAQDIGSAFKSAENSYQAGEVRWKLDGQDPGFNRIRVRAWDVLNNSSSAELDYLVAADEALTLRNVYNYPNPMNRTTRFVFEHNQPPGTPARVRIRIYTLNGRPIRTLETDEVLPAGVLTSGPVQISWDGRDQDFNRPSTGIYLYKVRVEIDGADGAVQVAERIEKLAVIR